MHAEPDATRDVLTIYSNPRPGTSRNPRYRFAFDRHFKLYDDGRFFDLERDPEETQPLAREELDPGARARWDALDRELRRMPVEAPHLRQ